MEQKFLKHFNHKPEYFTYSSGRFEIIGNHTDHNGGLCIAGACNLAISGCLSKRNDYKVNIVSEGYKEVFLDLHNLNVINDEKFSSASLVRGIAKYFVDHNYFISGFNLYIKSTIFKGAGVSSSAAFELLIATIFNEICNDGVIDSVTLAKAGQYAENEYFGKKSGLLDQTSIALANITFLDFAKDEVSFETIDWKFNDISIYLVNTGGDHGDLSDLYSNIPLKMKSAANKLGHQRLIECNPKDIDCASLTNEEKDFAKHFYDETARVACAKNAIINCDKKLFYKLINESRISSTNLLKNMQVGDCYEHSPLEACDFAMNIIQDKGACKINGGGFAGSIICFIDKKLSDNFKSKMSEKYGTNNIVEIEINNKKPYLKGIL